MRASVVRAASDRETKADTVMAPKIEYEFEDMQHEISAMRADINAIKRRTGMEADDERGGAA
eukprot:CAMPEP_0205935018 /NCGR_PEP_ID=MMETSP1325-20131115/38033_1 /ASSEMBLY_ACC=CAM_ASM_000708 /TAXON_ID=236786 /ORGANISM="Florenciella sp., Strain RCC1007" /LENGTH=61 /DNA_ID=CAMNT_0053305071 /DNA_START=6 /DNA_END=188 /DNA_ORIENTATION=+